MQFALGFVLVDALGFVLVDALGFVLVDALGFVLVEVLFGLVVSLSTETRNIVNLTLAKQNEIFARHEPVESSGGHAMRENMTSA